MPWSENCRMDERVRFVLDAQEGWTSMSELCRRYGVSRRVGYKWLDRYQEEGLSGLEDRSRAPKRQAEATPPELVESILALRRKHPTWGPRKLRAWLERNQPDAPWPACSTIGAILKREGLSEPRRRRARAPTVWSPPRTRPDEPNRVWTADFKGEFRLGCGRLCYPLTIVDACTRYLLDCRGLPGTGIAGSRATFERAFREYGLPEVIRTDNGIPFCSTRSVGGLTQLSVWWMRLGIRLERTRKSRPADNGAHERMHRTLKREATRPARRTPELQQRAFNQFRKIYNEERPHEALGLETPGSLYTRATRRMPRRMPPVIYPEGYQRRRVTQHGQIRWRRHHFFLSETLRRETVALNLREDGRWDVYFGPVPLAILDERESVLQRLDRPPPR